MFRFFRDTLSLEQQLGAIAYTMHSFMLLFSKSRTYQVQCMFNSRTKTGIGNPNPQTGQAPGTRLRKIAFDCEFGVLIER